MDWISLDVSYLNSQQNWISFLHLAAQSAPLSFRPMHFSVCSLEFAEGVLVHAGKSIPVCYVHHNFCFCLSNELKHPSFTSNFKPCGRLFLI